MAEKRKTILHVAGTQLSVISTMEEDRLQLETAVRKAVVACYAAEGFYPPDLEYLQEQYGIQISNHKYTVVYHGFGANLMPDITVVERTK